MTLEVGSKQCRRIYFFAKLETHWRRQSLPKGHSPLGTPTASQSRRCIFNLSARRPTSRVPRHDRVRFDWLDFLMSKTPQKKTGETRQIFPLRLSPSEKTALEAKATEADLKLSEYLRAAGLKQKISRQQPVPEVNRMTYVELSRIGINLNQLAKACNIAIQRGGGCNIDPSVLEDLRLTLQKIGYSVISDLDPDEEKEEE